MDADGVLFHEDESLIEQAIAHWSIAFIKDGARHFAGNFGSRNEAEAFCAQLLAQNN